MNIELLDNFNQVCVWPGTIVVKSSETRHEDIKAFEAAVLVSTGARIQYLEEIQTYPSLNEYGSDIEGTGGRNDLLFAVHDNDINNFAIKRFEYGIRWIEDAMEDAGNMIYPSRIQDYCNW